MSEKEPGIIKYFSTVDLVQNFQKDCLDLSKNSKDTLSGKTELNTEIKLALKQAEFAFELPVTFVGRLSGIASLNNLVNQMGIEPKDPFTGMDLPAADQDLEYFAKTGLHFSRLLASATLLCESAGAYFLSNNDSTFASILAIVGLMFAYTSSHVSNSYKDRRQMLMDRRWFKEQLIHNNKDFEYSSSTYKGNRGKPYPNFMVRQVISGGRKIDSLPVYRKFDNDRSTSLIDQHRFNRNHRQSEILCEVLVNSPCKKEDCPFFMPAGTIHRLNNEVPLCREFKMSFATKNTIAT